MAIKILEQVFCQTYLYTSLKLELPGHGLDTYITLKKTAKHYSKVVAHSPVQKSSICSISLPTFLIVSLDNLAVLVGMKRYFLIIIIFNLQMTDAVDCLCMCLLVIGYSLHIVGLYFHQPSFSYSQKKFLWYFLQVKITLSYLSVFILKDIIAQYRVLHRQIFLLAL